MRADKGHLYEGGIRIPLIVRWPGKVKPGTVSGEPVILTDFYNTMLEVAGLKPTPGVPADGESLVPLLCGAGKPKRDAIFFHYPNFAFHKDNRLGSAIREGDYKLIEFFEGDAIELYNVREDIGERNDLAKEKPELASRLKADLAKWRADSGAAMPKAR